MVDASLAVRLYRHVLGLSYVQVQPQMFGRVYSLISCSMQYEDATYVPFTVFDRIRRQGNIESTVTICNIRNN